MTTKSALYAVGVVVLMGSMAGVALAGYDWAGGAYKADPSVTSRPDRDMESSAASEIREPMETGSVPDSSENPVDRFKESSGELPTVELGGQVFRPGIDLGN